MWLRTALGILMLFVLLLVELGNLALRRNIDERDRARTVGVPEHADLELKAPQLLFRIGERLRALIEEQLVIDDERIPYSQPKLDAPFENIRVDGRNRTVLIDRILARSPQAVILTIQDEPTLVFKYQANCFDIRRLHPLVRDYIFLREAAKLGVSPAVHFLSPPIKFTDVPSVKTRFLMSRREQTECAEKSWTALRFMVMNRISETIDDRIGHYHVQGLQTPPLEVFDAMIGTIEGIRKLHENGIVHGDVHSGNIAFFDRNGSRTIGLIDFGHSFFLDEVEGTTRLSFTPAVPTHCLYSHWNIRGFRFAMRDDVFKALMVGAYHLNGPDWLAHCTLLEGKFSSMVHWKENGFLFRVPGLSNKLSELARHTRNAIESHLETALALARSVESVDGIPPYDEILSALSAARALVQQ